MAFIQILLSFATRRSAELWLAIRRRRSVLVNASVSGLCFLALHGAARPVLANAKSWNNPSGGSAATSTNWSPNGVPGISDFLEFDLNNNYTVTFSSAVPHVNSHIFFRGDVNLSITGTHTVSSYFGIQQDSATLTGGTLVCQDRVDVGRSTAVLGTLNVQGATSDLQTVVLNVGDDPIGLGNPNRGALNVTGGGSVTTDELNLATYNGATADVVVSGITLLPLTRSLLTANGPITAGISGDATLAVSSGANVHAVGNNGSITIAQRPASISSVTVGGAVAFYEPSVAADDDLLIGRALDGTSGGVGTLTVNNGGNAWVGHTTRVGHSGGGSGTLIVHTGADFTSGDLLFDDTHGFFTFDGGVVHIDGGTFDPIGTSLTVNSTVGSPDLELTNGASLTLTQPASPFKALEIGSTGAGLVHLLNNSTCTISTGNVALGRNSGGSGTLIVDSNADFTGAAGWNLSFGLSGTGAGSIGAGGHVTAGSVNLGTQASGVGTLTVQGTGALLTALDRLYIGGYSGGAAGAGTVTVGDGGQVDVDQTGTSTTIWNGGGVLNVNANGTFTSTGTIDHRGEINLAGGTIDAAQVTFTGAADLTGRGTVQGRIFANDPAAAINASGGVLTLGDLADPAGFVNVGTLNVGSQTVYVHDSNEATLGNVVMAGGSLIEAHGGVLSAGKTISGNGTIIGGVTNSGTLTATGSGLGFQGGLLTGVGQGISGTLLHFMTAGGYSGDGTLNCKIDADGGALISATGDLVMGLLSSPTGVVIDGLMSVGSHSVTLLDSNGADIGAYTSLSGGILACPSGILMSASDDLTGRGVVATSLVNAGGTIAPGSSAGKITVAGFLNSSGTLSMQIGDHAAGEWDTLAVTGSATISGALNVLSLPGFTATAGDSFPILTAATVSGTFSTFAFNGGDPTGQLDLVYLPTRVVLVVHSQTNGIGNPGALPGALTLAGRHSQGESTMELALPKDADVRLSVFDVTGREVAVLAEGVEKAGVHSYGLGGRRLPSGIYFGRVRAATPGGVETRTARIWLVR